MAAGDGSINAIWANGVSARGTARSELVGRFRSLRGRGLRSKKRRIDAWKRGMHLIAKKGAGNWCTNRAKTHGIREERKGPDARYRLGYEPHAVRSGRVDGIP